MQRFGGPQRLGFSRRDWQRLQLSESLFASIKMICHLRRIADVELRRADDAPVRDCMPNAKAPLVPGISFSPIRELLDRRVDSARQMHCDVAQAGISIRQCVLGL